MEIINDLTEVKAKKIHSCDYCGGRIRISEKYLKGTFKIDDIYTWKCHRRCYELTHKLDMFDDVDTGHGLTMDDFHEHINQYFMDMFIDELQSIDKETNNKFSKTTSKIADYLNKVHFQDKLRAVFHDIAIKENGLKEKQDDDKK